MGHRLVWVAASAVAILAGWWWLDQPSRSQPRQADSAAIGGRVAESSGRAPDGSPTSPSSSIPTPSETERRRSPAPPRAALSARHAKALERLREGGGVREVQGAFLALLHPYTSDDPLRAGLEILGGRSDELQRGVFTALRTRLRPEVREALARLAAEDASPRVRRAAGLALEVAEGDPDPVR